MVSARSTVIPPGSAGGPRAPPMGWSPLSRGAPRALGSRQWQDRDAYIHDLKSKGRAATRRKAAPHGLSGPSAAYLAAISSSLAASPSRASTAARPTQRGPERASEPASERGRGACEARRARCQPLTKRPGTSRVAAAAAAAGESPGAAAPVRALPRRASCRLLLLRLLLLLPADRGLGGKRGLRPLGGQGGRGGRPQHVPP